MPKKTAVILFNLGGPDSLDAVKPFLFNLFYDKAIINLPNPMRFLLAKLIAGRRTKFAKNIYSEIGGKSPILAETSRQEEFLHHKLNDSEDEYKVFISMRYWHPFVEKAIAQVKEYKPDEIILLPLYPQFSTATTKSSIDEWNVKAKGLNIPTKTIYYYHKDVKFIQSHVSLIEKNYAKIIDKSKVRILFSAHGLPKKLIDAGDPYQQHIEETAAAIVQKLAIENLDWKICYQSKVGRLEWLAPSTEDEIIFAAKNGYSLVIVAISFVSEHSETLVELDIEYKKLAEKNGVKQYVRVPTLSVDEFFIDSLADMCKKVELWNCQF
jgi:ferrochelatase